MMWPTDKQSEHLPTYLPLNVGQMKRKESGVIFSATHFSPHKKMALLFRSIVTLLVLVVWTSSALGASKTASPSNSFEQRYHQAKFYYNQLETKGSLGDERDNWLKGASNFRRLYLSSPKSELAPACLYMLGRMYYRMYKKFGTGIDLGESLSYYRDTANLFTNHRLADDALFAIGNILLNDINDPKRAAKAYATIVSQHPNGDMHSMAATTLKKLSKDHNIPLPEIMIESTTLKGLSYVLPVKYWSSNNYTRVVIKASGPVTYREELLEQRGNKPRRLYIDFKNSYIEPKYRAPVPIEDGLLRQIRTGQFTPDTVRVVLDIESISDYKIFSLPDPFRVVIDVRGKEALLAKQPDLPTTNANKVAPAPQVESPQIIILKETRKFLRDDYIKEEESAVQVAAVNDNKEEEPALVKQIAEPPSQPLSLAQQLGLGVQKIVIDPGHGGKDPGAMAFGMKEKDIVLAVAKKLATILRAETGTEVILTREEDVFIPLEERTAIANANDADLFISLHLNAHPSPKVRGLETYFLNLSTNAEAMRVAARENATSTHQMSDLEDILSDIMKNSKINESSRLAEQVHQSILQGLEEQEFDKTKNLGVKQAPFYVLIGAEMPSILLELGFLSNPEESSYFKDDHYLNIVSEEIAEGVKRYINSTTAAL